MSEVPDGVQMPVFERRPPRPSATLMITRDGDEGVEVLLGKRSDSMPSFPGYWAFPGGGVSRIDKEASESLGISIQHCAIMREVVEELGLAPQNGQLIAVEPDFREMVAEDKANWFPLALDGDIPSDTTGMRVISMRTTPPFGPMRFENTFLHIHSNDHDDFSLIGQTEFIAANVAKVHSFVRFPLQRPTVTLLPLQMRCVRHLTQ